MVLPPDMPLSKAKKGKIVGVVRGAYLKFGPKFQYIFKKKVEEFFLVGHD
jgi:hypothetical protein